MLKNSEGKAWSRSVEDNQKWVGDFHSRIKFRGGNGWKIKFGRIIGMVNFLLGRFFCYVFYSYCQRCMSG